MVTALSIHAPSDPLVESATDKQATTWPFCTIPPIRAARGIPDCAGHPSASPGDRIHQPFHELQGDIEVPKMILNIVVALPGYGWGKAIGF
jgi:hypothetical protein